MTYDDSTTRFVQPEKSGGQTYCFRGRYSANPTGEFRFFEAEDDATGADDELEISSLDRQSSGGPNIRMNFDTQTGGSESVYGEVGDRDTPLTTFETFAVSIDHPSDNQSANSGGALVDWEDDWDEDAGEGFTSYTNQPVNLTLGEVSENSGINFDLTDFVIVDGYEFDCTTLPEWGS